MKCLGGNRIFKRILPSDLNYNLPRPAPVLPPAEEEEEEEVTGVLTSGIPPHEPLILWTDPDDETNKIQVSYIYSV